MSEMVERVARAISPLAFEIANAEMIDRAKMEARAAIAAMREPTEKMLDELDLANCGWGTREHSKELWNDLIAIALEDK